MLLAPPRSCISPFCHSKAWRISSPLTVPESPTTRPLELMPYAALVPYRWLNVHGQYRDPSGRSAPACQMNPWVNSLN
jgi:hypothetical protein